MTRWDGPLAEALLLRAGGFRAPGRYQPEAAVQSAHSVRRHGQAPDPQAILLLYEALHARTRSPVAAVNHAVALCAAAGPAAALEALDVLAGTHALSQYQPYWAARAHVLALCARRAEALQAYQRAIGLERDAAVRSFLQARAERLAAS